MASKKAKRGMKVQMIIVLVMAIIMVGSVFLPWMMASYDIEIPDRGKSIKYYGHEFLDALMNGKDSISLKDLEAGIIYLWTKNDKTQAASNALLFAVAGALVVSLVLAASSLLGLVTKAKMFKLINKISGILLILIGLIGTICSFAIIKEVHGGVASELLNVKRIVIAPFIIAFGGLATTLVSSFVKK